MRALLHPSFVLALIALLLNDHLLKATYGNFLTGKLSDFAGLFVFAVFAESLHRLVIGEHKHGLPWGILLTGVFFAWFKSPLSEWALADAGELLGMHFSRVVDYTDLLALVVLLPAYGLVENFSRERALALPRPTLSVIIPLSLFAFVATSVDDDFSPGEVTYCCGFYPSALEVGNGTIYVPTAFTPDADGVNDIFLLFPDSNIVRIDSFIVYDPFSGESIFRRDNITDFTSGGGLEFGGPTLDSLPPAAFRYTITATAQDSTTLTVVGEVCALPCDRPISTSRPLQVDSCVYGSQYVPGVGFDTSIPSGESLECFN